MIVRKIKAFGMIALVLAVGLALGLFAGKLPKLLERPYLEGNYASHFTNPDSKIVLYGTTTCPFCAKAREYLIKKNIAFTDFNVDVSEEAQKKFASLKVKAVPAILIGDRLITGYRPETIDEALKELRK